MASLKTPNGTSATAGVELIDLTSLENDLRPAHSSAHNSKGFVLYTIDDNGSVEESFLSKENGDRDMTDRLNRLEGVQTRLLRVSSRRKRRREGVWQSYDSASIESVKMYKTDPNERDEVVLLGKPPTKFEPRKQKPLTPELAVLEVFPDAEISHVKKLLAENENKLDTVISLMAEQPYPKVELKKPPPSICFELKASKWKHDYMSTSSFEPSINYKIQAQVQLLHECKCIIQIQWEKRRNFTFPYLHFFVERSPLPHESSCSTLSAAS